MDERYECIMSARRRGKFYVIHYHLAKDQGFKWMPGYIQDLGPWTDTRIGDLGKLRPEYGRCWSSRPMC